MMISKKLVKCVAITVAIPVAAYALLAIGSLIFLYGDFVLHNETIYSSKFSWKEFSRIQVGTPRQQVVALLGDPIELYPHCGCMHPREQDPHCTGQLWAVPKNGYGYFAKIDFVEEQAVRTDYWEDD